MTLKNDGRLDQWVVEAPKAHGGGATIMEICKYVWQHYELELRKSGDGFYTWQYDIRWAGDRLRNERVLQPKNRGDRGPWRVAGWMIDESETSATSEQSATPPK